MNSFAVSLPMPPSINAAFRNVTGIGRVKTSAYKAWRTGAATIIKAAWSQQGKPSFERHLSLTIHLGLNYTGDVSNRVKAIEDSLVEAIPGFPDDRYIDRLEVERVPNIDGARVLVTQLAPPEKRRGEAVSIGDLVRPIVADIQRRIA